MAGNLLLAKELSCLVVQNKEGENQLRTLREFHRIQERQEVKELDWLKTAVLDSKNVFGQLMSTTRYCSLGQITSILFSVGGKYRRNM